VHYKLLYLARHGEGYHNVAESYYSMKEWDNYWSKQDGNGTITWADAELTPTGEAQALTAGDFWKEALTDPAVATEPPGRYYVSPLARTLQTAELTWGALGDALPAERPFEPVVVERFRETLGVHTCDRRHPKSWIAAHAPSFAIENGFTEEDELWRPDVRESLLDEEIRARKALDGVFDRGDGGKGEGEAFVSVTSHSGAIAALLRVVGHREFRLETGGVIAAFVKGERVGGKREEV
jgi:broad specificity phosphatase PhoE